MISGHHWDCYLVAFQRRMKNRTDIFASVRARARVCVRDWFYAIFMYVSLVYKACGELRSSTISKYYWYKSTYYVTNFHKVNKLSLHFQKSKYVMYCQLVWRNEACPRNSIKINRLSKYHTFEYQTLLIVLIKFLYPCSFRNFKTCCITSFISSFTSFGAIYILLSTDFISMLTKIDYFLNWPKNIHVSIL